MILDIMCTNLNKINLFPKTIVEEIMQNIKTLLTTIVGTVPLDRKLGIDGTIIDYPINKAIAKFSIYILESIQEYEPRVIVLEIDYEKNLETALDGKLYPRVKVRVKDDYIR